MLPGSALKVPGGGGGWWWWWWVASYPLLSQAPTPVEVELGCDNKQPLQTKSGTILSMYTLTIYSIVQLCPNLVAHLLCNPMSKLLPQAVTDNWTLTTNDVYRRKMSGDVL